MAGGEHSPELLGAVCQSVDLLITSPAGFACCCCSRGLLWGAPSPGAQDPSLLIGRTVELIGRLQADARVFETSCSALIDVERIDCMR